MRLFSYFRGILRKHKTRYLACVIGFSVALGAVFAISAFTSLLDETVNDFYFLEDETFMILGEGTNIVQLVPFESQIPEEVIPELEDYPGISFTFPMIFKELSNSSDYAYFKQVMLGMDLSQLNTFLLKGEALQAGNWPSPESNEILLGSLVGQGNLLPGDTLKFVNETYTISGILNPNNPLFDNFIYIDYSELQSLYNMDGYCSMIYIVTDGVSLENQEDVTELELFIENQFPTVNFIDNIELDDAAGNYYKALDAFTVVLTGFPLIISGLFILVLMILNIKEQEREFGMLRAIGMSNGNIVKIVFSQSLFIGIFGFIFSLLIGNLYFTYAFYVFDFANQGDSLWNYINDMRKQIPLTSYINTLLIALLVSGFIAIYPIYRATRLSIVESFRKEQ